MQITVHTENGDVEVEALPVFRMGGMSGAIYLDLDPDEPPTMFVFELPQ